MPRSTTVALWKRKPDGIDEMVDAAVSFSTSPPWTLELVHPELGTLTGSADDLFDCLVVVRRKLEPHGWLPLCAGARVDTYPSQMCRQMSGGLKVYITKIGQPGQLEDLRELFEAAPRDAVGTVRAQKEFHDTWIRSLGRE